MRGVSIIGVGTTPFGKLGMTLKEIATKACMEALDDAKIPAKGVEAFYLGNFISGMLTKQETVAGKVARGIGLIDIPSTKVEGACSSSSIALRQGFLLVSSGLCNFVLVCGVEKMTGLATDVVTEAISSPLDDVESKCGLTFPGFFALYMRNYLHMYKASREQFAMVSVKNHKNGLKNPRAQFRRTLTVDEVLNSRPISDPITLLDCCPISDGASAAVLCPSTVAKKYADTPIDVVASVQTTGYSSAYEAFDHGDLTSFRATRVAAKQAYEMANVKCEDVDVVELHDCFTPAEIIDSEDLGFFNKGEGAKAVEEGVTEVDGRIPINPSGGLLSKGHPVGATGVGQIYELAIQLRGEAENQVSRAEVGLAHNMGGPGLVCTIHLLKRR